MLGRDPARTDMFGGAGHAGITGVEVHLGRVHQIAANHRALEEVQMLERVHHARDVVQIERGRVAVFAAVRVHHMHRRAGRAEIDTIAPGLHVVLRILAMQHEMARGIGDGVLDQGAREQKAPGIGQGATGLGQVLDAAGRRVGKANLL